MSLAHAHKGYEYQDLFTAYHILNVLLANENATFLLDKKETRNDKFDDLTIITEKSVIKRQIKYSEDKKLKKADLSTANYDLALDTLFQSWKEMPKDIKKDIILCLAWEYIEDAELDFLIEIDSADLYQDSGTRVFTINLDSIWPLNNDPIPSWKRLKREVLEKNINRDEFAEFIEALKIEVNLPKSSINLNEPGQLERLVLRNLKLFGVGKFPNNKKDVVDVAMHLMHLIKHFRAKGDSVEISKIVYDLGLIKSHGNIDQEFIIDQNINVLIPEKYTSFKEHIYKNQKSCLTGAPGSGKSWFIQNFKDTLEREKINVIEHYCYTGIDDNYEKERITINIFLANLINDILNIFPHLENRKVSRYGVDFEELQFLLNEIREDVVLIVDGLDHIGRIYNMHRELITGIDTEIVNTISRLNFPDNIKVVLASQPYSDVLALQDKGFEIFNIEPWDIDEVAAFMKKNNLNDVSLHFGYKLSELLLKKSEGNPLYLTYLVNELSVYSSNMVSKDLIEQFPPYNDNLEDYYLYLMSKLDESSTVPQILAGSPFSLNEEELKEITGIGKYVTSSLKVIRSILSYNSSSGGYMIYHESFRRFTLNLLEKNELSVEKVIYRPLIDWLSQKGVYTNRKSYLNLFILLFESKRYDQILEYCNKEFIVESIFGGNNIVSINNNLEIIMKAACKVKNYGGVIKCTELNSMMISFQYAFEENSEYYYLALGLVNGFDNLKEVLIYENDIALSLDEGLKVCYLCSQNFIVPEWEKYINLLKKTRKEKPDNLNDRVSDLDYYKYFICGHLDMGTEMSEIISKPSKKGFSDYRRVIIEEYVKRERLQELNEMVLRINPSQYWIESISEYLGNNRVDEKYLETMFEDLKNSDSHSDSTSKAINYYYKNIDWIILNHNEALQQFIKEIKNRNWYFNWLIFIYEVNKILPKIRDNSTLDTELVKSFSWLIKDTDCFTGKPRTCDLYNYESIIYESIANPLKYINSATAWDGVLSIIDEMSSETMTSMRGIVGGPLPTHKLLNLFLEITNPTNYKYIIEIFDKRTKEEDERRIYTYLADYSLKHTILLAKNQKYSDAKLEFRKGIQYLLAYGSRKDRTLSRLLNSVGSIYSIDGGQGIDRILKLKPLADAVVNHTDGKSTNSYPVEWFEILVNHDRSLAIEDLSLELIDYDNTWVLEDSFDYLLESIDNSIDPIIENILFKTRPGNTKTNFLNSFLNNIQVLISRNETSLATHSMTEFLTRFSSEIRELDTERIESICIELGISHSLIVSKDSHENRHSVRENNSRKEKVRLVGLEKSIDKMSYEELIDYVMNYGIDKDEVKYVIKIFESIEELNDESKLFIYSFIKVAYEKFEDDRSNFIKVLDSVSLEESVMAYVYMSRFLHHKDGWFNKFTETIFFVEAMKLNRCATEQYFFEYFYSEFYIGNYYLSVGDQIINALAASTHDEDRIIEYWDSLFEIISFRLPGKRECNFEDMFAEFRVWNDTERLLLLLITRFKFGESTRYKWLISGLNKLLVHSSYREQFIKPFLKYLERYKELTDYSLMILLHYISKWYTHEELVRFEVIDSLSEIYPTDNEAVNYQIRKITEIEKARVIQKYDYWNKGEDLSLYGYTTFLANVDKRLKDLEERNLNISNIVNRFMKLVLVKETKEKLNHLVHDRLYHLNIDNVYFHDILTKEMASEVDKVLNSYAEFPMINQLESELFEIVIGNIEYFNADINSISVRPIDLVLPKDVKEGIVDFEHGMWCRVAYYEKWYDQRKKHTGNFENSIDSVLVTSGVMFGEDGLNSPFLQLSNEYRRFDENPKEHLYCDEEDSDYLVVASDLNCFEDQFINFTMDGYLVLKNELLNALKIRIVDQGDGIVGLDSSDKIVIKFSKWEVCFEDDQENYRIPYLKGAELKIKSHIFDEICEKFDSIPKTWTKKVVIN